jgi:dUTP pyrophosphatase
MIQRNDFIIKYTRFMISVQRVHPLAKLPVRGSKYSAGLDISSVQEITVPAGGRALIDTGLIFELPSGHYGQIAPRSGLALKHGIHILGGVIDEDYRGNCKVILQNFGKDDFSVKVGDRIAQFIVIRINNSDVCEKENLGNTSRGTSGFGSTGV